MRKRGAWAVVCSLLGLGLRVPAGSAATPDAEVAGETIELHVTNTHTAFENGSRAVRILTEAGLDAASFVIPVYPFTTVSEVKGTLTLPDGKVINLDPANVIEQPLLNEAVASEVKVLRGHFPGAVVGSTVRLSWRRQLRSLLYVDDWVFSGPRPIVRSSYRLVVPKDLALRWIARNGKVEPQVSEDGDFRTYSFEATGSAAVEREVFAPPLHALLGRVQFYFPRFDYGEVTLDLQEWKGVAAFYRQIAENRYTLDSALAAEIKAEARQLGEPAAIISSILDRLAAFRYVQVYLGMGGYQPHAAAWTLERRYGDCKDLATVLVGMLRAGGIEAYPMLTRLERGYPFVDDLPSPKQFNHCVAYVPLKDGPLVLDATAPRYPPGVLPGALSGAPGLVVREGGKQELLTLPRAKPESNAARIELSLELAPDGGLQGTFTARLEGDRRVQGYDVMDAGEEHLEGAATNALLPALRSSRIHQPRFRPEGDVLVVEGRLDSSIEPAAAGRERLLAPSMLLEDARSRAFGAVERRQPVDLGGADETTYRIRYRAAAPARCPAPFSVEGSAGRYRLTCTSAAGEVVFDRTLTVERPWIEPADYAEARAFWLAVLRGDRMAAAIAEAP